MSDPQIRRHKITTAELEARIEKAGHDLPLNVTMDPAGRVAAEVMAYPVDGKPDLVTWTVMDPGECAGCGAYLRVDPGHTLTMDQAMDPLWPIPVDYSHFDYQTHTFTSVGACPAAEPAIYSVEIPVPSGELVLANFLTSDRDHALYYEPGTRGTGSSASDLSINSVLGRRMRTQHCAAQLGYGCVSTTVDVRVLRTDSGGLLLEHAWVDEDGADVCIAEVNLDVWSVEMMDLEAFSAATGRTTEAVRNHPDYEVVAVPAGTYRLTVLNEAFERGDHTAPAGVASLELI